MTSLRTKAVVRLPMRVWDSPIRLFHWALVLLIPFSFVSIKANWVTLHLLSGYTVLTLLLFRLAWGVVGSDTARFSAFLRSPIAGLRHLARFGRRVPDDQVGHNEAGGWMVLAMLLLIAIQVGTGLFANDDGATEGPFAAWVDKPTSNWLSAVHSLSFWPLLAFIVLHIVAIAAYAKFERHDLIRPMLTGKKMLPAATPAPRMASPLLAAAILAMAAIVVVILATRI